MGDQQSEQLPGCERFDCSTAEKALPAQLPRMLPRGGHLPACGADMRGTEEKGVDLRMATDMISLAWADNYDIAVLVSSDQDFVPVAEFLETRGIKVIHGAFPPLGAHLTRTCWGSIGVSNLREDFRFTPSAASR